MFDYLYDAISLLWSWRWPEIPGEVTAVDIDRVQDSDGIETFRLAVAYKFRLAMMDPTLANRFGNQRCPPNRGSLPPVIAFG